MSIELRSVDREVYERELKDFLPARLVDVHTHIWLKAFEAEKTIAERGAQWAGKVASQNQIPDLLEEYQQMLPGKQVIPVVFGWPGRHVDIDANNYWVSDQAHQYGFPALLLSTPEMSADYLEKMVGGGGFAGLKPYLDFAPPDIPSTEITIYDFLPRQHLELADQHGWVIILHIPRTGRLSDPVNLEQLLEIDSMYPHAKVIVAHLGRAYCPQDIGNAMQVLRRTRQLFFDFSANTCAEVMAEMIHSVGIGRIMFGSDMPITHMRMNRICEDGKYINLVPPGVYGDLSGDPHMREVAEAEERYLTFFLYEQMLAMRRAAQVCSLTSDEIEAIFYRNAAALFHLVEKG